MRHTKRPRTSPGSSNPNGKKPSLTQPSRARPCSGGTGSGPRRKKHGTICEGDVVIIPFPSLDLTTTKRRPALVVAAPGGDNIILCQITGREAPGSLRYQYHRYGEGTLHKPGQSTAEPAFFRQHQPDPLPGRHIGHHPDHRYPSGRVTSEVIPATGWRGVTRPRLVSRGSIPDPVERRCRTDALRNCINCGGTASMICGEIR